MGGRLGVGRTETYNIKGLAMCHTRNYTLLLLLLLFIYLFNSFLFIYLFLFLFFYLFIFLLKIKIMVSLPNDLYNESQVYFGCYAALLSVNIR